MKGRTIETGAAFVELAIVIILLLGLFLGAFEFTRAFRAQVAINSISRELASSVFESCENVFIFQLSGSSLDQCVDAVASQFYADLLANPSLPDMDDRLILHLKVWHEPVTTISPNYCTGPGSPREFSYGISNFPQDLSRITPQRRKKLSSLCESGHGMITVSEVRYRYEPMIEAIAGIFDYKGGQFYAGAIY